MEKHQLIDREGWSPGTAADVPAPLRIRPRIPPKSSQIPENLQGQGKPDTVVEQAVNIGSRDVSKALPHSSFLKRAEQSKDEANNAKETISGENSAQETPGKSPRKPISRLIKKLSTIFRHNRDVDDDKVSPSRQHFEAPSAPPLSPPSIAMTYENAADSTPRSQPSIPRSRSPWHTVSGEENQTQNSLNRSLTEKPSPFQMSNPEKENKKSPRITNSRNAYETASTLPESQSSQGVSSQVVSASTGTTGDISSGVRPKPLSERLRALKPSPKSWLRRKGNAPTSPVLLDNQVKIDTNEQHRTASSSYPNALGISGLYGIKSDPSTSEMELSPFDVTPGSRVPTLSDGRARNISEPRPPTSRPPTSHIYKSSQADKTPSRSSRRAERVRADDYPEIGQPYPQEQPTRSYNTAIATAPQNEISMTKVPAKPSELRGRSSSHPSPSSSNNILSQSIGPMPDYDPPPPPIPPPQMMRRQVSPSPRSPQPPPTPSRRRRATPPPAIPIPGFDKVEAAAQPPPAPSRRRRMTPPQEIPMFSFDGADDFRVVDNSDKFNRVGTKQSMERKAD